MQQVIRYLAGLLVLLAVSVMADSFDIGKTIIYDVPDSALKTISPIQPGSELTPDELKEMTTYRFAGDSVRMLVVLVEWIDRQIGRAHV